MTLYEKLGILCDVPDATKSYCSGLSAKWNVSSTPGREIDNGNNQLFSPCIIVIMHIHSCYCFSQYVISIAR